MATSDISTPRETLLQARRFSMGSPDNVPPVSVSFALIVASAYNTIAKAHPTGPQQAVLIIHANDTPLLKVLTMDPTAQTCSPSSFPFLFLDMAQIFAVHLSHNPVIGVYS